MPMYNEEMRRELLIALHGTPGIGWHSIRKAVDCGDWRSYANYTEEAWRETVGLKPEQAKAVVRALAGRDESGPKAERERLSKLGAAVITIYDDGYPESLRHMPQPPWVLYTIGRMELLERPSIAIVGTRGPTAYGRRMATELAQGLSGQGIAVVSGLARGIDSIAHRGALPGAGGTVAVLGTPIDRVYPPENRSLYREIGYGGNGLLLTEVAPGTPSHPGLFPLRNRIIAGLSMGTVVVEAAERSGSLITADQAFDMSRDVFAVPGMASSPKSEGTNRIIRDGIAKLVTSAEHILDEYEARLVLPQCGESVEGSTGVQREPELTADEERTYKLLLDRPLTLDELLELTGYPFGLLHAVLLNLTVKRKIEQHPGSLYSVR